MTASPETLGFGLRTPSWGPVGYVVREGLRGLGARSLGSWAFNLVEKIKPSIGRTGDTLLE